MSLTKYLSEQLKWDSLYVCVISKINYLWLVYYVSIMSTFLCQQSHPCPTDSYEVQFINKDDENEQPKMEKIHSFPHTIPSLTPYTSYDVTIWHRNKNLFWKKVRTLEDGELNCIFNIS